MSILDQWRAQLGSSRDQTARQAREVRRRAHLSESRSPFGTIAAAIGGAAAGATLALLFDPARGRGRRAQLADRALGGARAGQRRFSRAIRGSRARVTGLAARGAAAMSDRAPDDVNDATLAERVESELFSDQTIPKGALNVNAENGIVVVRGELPDAEMRDRVETAIRRIPGVWEVNNLTHLPGEPAPTAR